MTKLCLDTAILLVYHLSCRGLKMWHNYDIVLQYAEKQAYKADTNPFIRITR